jgi:hypothetical protein
MDDASRGRGVAGRGRSCLLLDLLRPRIRIATGAAERVAEHRTCFSGDRAPVATSRTSGRRTRRPRSRREKGTSDRPARQPTSRSRGTLRAQRTSPSGITDRWACSGHGHLHGSTVAGWRSRQSSRQMPWLGASGLDALDHPAQPGGPRARIAAGPARPLLRRLPLQLEPDRERLERREQPEAADEQR